jgi:type I restriction enzyme S subunit
MFGNGNDFETVKFKELMVESPRNGLYLPSSEYGSGTPIIRIDNFYGGILSHPDTFKRVRAKQKHIEDYAVQNGEILINRVNSLDYLGKCALVKGISEPTVFESNMMRIRLNQERIHPIYLARYLTTPQAHAQILQHAKKAVNQASINQQDVKSLSIPTPPLPLQEEFAAIVRRFEHLRAQQRESERQAEHLFQTLLHRAFAE